MGEKIKEPILKIENGTYQPSDFLSLVLGIDPSQGPLIQYSGFLHPQRGGLLLLGRRGGGGGAPRISIIGLSRPVVGKPWLANHGLLTTGAGHGLHSSEAGIGFLVQFKGCHRRWTGPDDFIGKLFKFQ